MAKTVPNKPQNLRDSQWLLSWQGSTRTDVISALIDGRENRVSPFEKSGEIAVFAKPDNQSNGLLLDLGRVPTGIQSIDFSFDVIEEGDRAWTIEGLGTGEIWQNESVKVPADAPCLVLTLERTQDGWTVTAREKVLGEQADVAVDDRIPDTYRELVARATARGLGQQSGHFFALLDITPNMESALSDGTVASILNCIVAIGASRNNRPLEVSFHGLSDLRVSVDDDLERSYASVLKEALEERQTAKPLHTLVPSVCSALKQNSMLYVITNSMFFVEDDLFEDLERTDSVLQILLLGEEPPKFATPDSKVLKITPLRLDSFSDPRLIMDLLG